MSTPKPQTPFEKAVAEMPEGTIWKYDPSYKEALPLISGFNHKSGNNTPVQYCSWAVEEIARIGANIDGISFEACVNHLRAYLKCVQKVDDAGVVYEWRLKNFQSGAVLTNYGKSLGDALKAGGSPAWMWSLPKQILDRVIKVMPDDGVTGLIRRNAATHRAELSTAAEKSQKIIDELKKSGSVVSDADKKKIEELTAEIVELKAARDRVGELAKRITEMEVSIASKDSTFSVLKESFEKLEIEAAGLRAAVAEYQKQAALIPESAVPGTVGDSEGPSPLVAANAEIARLNSALQSSANRIKSLETLNGEQKERILRLELEVAKFENPGRSASNSEKDSLDLEAVKAVGTIALTFKEKSAEARKLVDSAVQYAKMSSAAAVLWVRTALKTFNDAAIPSFADFEDLIRKLDKIMVTKPVDRGYWSWAGNGIRKWVVSPITKAGHAILKVYGRAENAILGYLHDKILSVYERADNKSGAVSYAGVVWGNAAVLAATPYTYLRGIHGALAPIGIVGALLATPLAIVMSAVSVLGDALCYLWTKAPTVTEKLRSFLGPKKGEAAKARTRSESPKDPNRRTRSNGWAQGARGWHPTRPFRRGLGGEPRSTPAPDRGRSASVKALSGRSDYSISPVPIGRPRPAVGVPLDA